MEWAVAIPRDQVLGWLDNYFCKNGKELDSDLIAAVWDAGETQFGSSDIRRLYFGQEFCEKALPTLKELDQALEMGEKKGLAFTLVTPYVTEEGLGGVKNLLAQLAKLKPQAEVVVNDWGVLELLVREYPALTPVLGRLLNKVLRDPRLFAHIGKGKCTLDNTQTKTLENLRQSSLAGEPMQTLLAGYKVKRLEMDLPPQGLDHRLSALGYDLSLYLPYGVITTGRICLMHSWGENDIEKFKPFIGGCERKCRYYWLAMTDPSGQVPKSKDWTIWQKGNTVFYRQNKDFIKKGLEKAKEIGITRVVIQKEPL